MSAWTEDLKGEEAFYALSGWTKARFAFNSMRREEQRTLNKPTLTLLMEAMRRLEEKLQPEKDVGLDALFGSP